eukprot:788929-Prymnesium_polylepis.1
MAHFVAAPSRGAVRRTTYNTAPPRGSISSAAAPKSQHPPLTSRVPLGRVANLLLRCAQRDVVVVDTLLLLRVRVAPPEGKDEAGHCRLSNHAEALGLRVREGETGRQQKARGARFPNAHIPAQERCRALRRFGPTQNTFCVQRQEEFAAESLRSFAVQAATAAQAPPQPQHSRSPRVRSRAAPLQTF